MKKLPNDLIVYIGIYLELPSVLNLSLASKRYYQLVLNGKNFWITRLKNDFNIDSCDYPKTEYKRIYQKLPTANIYWLLENSAGEGDLNMVKACI